MEADILLRDADKYSDPARGFSKTDKIGPKAYDLAGHKFGRITLVKPFSRMSRPDGTTQSYTWEAVCECGTRFVILGNKVTKKNGTQSCGCLQHEQLNEVVGKMNYAKTGRYAVPKNLMVKSLAKLDPRHKDYRGMRFGSLTVVRIDRIMEYKYSTKREGKVYSRHIVYYECKCDCGKFVVRPSSGFFNNKRVKNMSCGCSRTRHYKTRPVAA